MTDGLNWNWIGFESGDSYYVYNDVVIVDFQRSHDVLHRVGETRALCFWYGGCVVLVGLKWRGSI